MIIYNYLNLVANKYPNKIAFISHTKKITFIELKKKVEYLATALKNNGVKSNQKVGILSNNSIDYIIIQLACAVIGAVLVPISVSMAKKDIIYQIKFTDVQCIFLWHAVYYNLQKKLLKLKIKKKNIVTIGKKIKNVKFLDELINNKKKTINKFYFKNKTGSNPYLIILTSGSTSNPKAIVFSQKTKLLRALSVIETYNIKRSDKLILSTPIKQSISQRFIHLSLVLGCTTVLMENFSVNSWVDLIKKFKITFSILVASQIKNIVKYIMTKDSRLKTLKKLVSCCAELDSQTKSLVIKKKLSRDFYDTYGATEVGTVTNLNVRKFLIKRKRDLLGAPIKGVSIKILDKNNKEIKQKNKKGIIACKSKFIFSHYLKSDLKKKNTFKGYFKTGDIGYLDNVDMLHLTGREKEMIIVGGVNVFPEDIERVLDSNKIIKKSAVIGLKDKRLGEAVLACIVLKKKKKINLLEMKKFCLKNLSDYQQPHKFIILKKLPIGGYGKISKFMLRKKYKNLDLSKNLRAIFS